VFDRFPHVAPHVGAGAACWSCNWRSSVRAPRTRGSHPCNPACGSGMQPGWALVTLRRTLTRERLSCG